MSKRAIGSNVACRTLVVLMCSYWMSSHAQEITATVGYEAEGTDNIGRRGSDTRRELIHRPWLEAGFEQDFQRLELDARYRFEARRYQRSTFSGDEVLVGRSAANVLLLPGRLEWLTDHVRSETLLDRRDEDRPDNRRESDTLGTGLTFMAGHGTGNAFTANVRTERFRSNRGFDDSDRHSGGLSYRRATSPVQGVGLLVTGRSVDFDEDLVADFDQWSAQVTFDRELRASGLEIALGYNEIKRSDGPDRDGVAGSIDAFWTPAPGHRTHIGVSRHLTDQTLATMRGVPEFDDDRDQGTMDGNVFEETSIVIGHEVTGERRSIGLELSWTDEDFDTVLRDVRIYGARIRFGYRVSPAINLDLSLRGARRDFRDENRKDDDLRADLRVNWAAGRRTNVMLRLGHDDRDSSTPGRSYNESRVVVGISYRLR